MDHLQGLRAAVAELQAEVRRQRDEILLLRSIKPKPKPSLPNPEKFSGQPYKFDTWLPSIKAKLRVDGEAIGDTVAQFYYVYLNLESHIQAMVLPQLHQAVRVYDNPNKVQEAEDKLLALKQGTDSIPAYVAKFERVLYEARGQNWPDVNKISTFRNGLSSTIRSRLAQQLNLPRKYPDFVRVVQQLAGRTSQAPTSGNSNGSGSGPGPGPGNHHYHGEPMEVGSINAIHVSSPQQRARSISPTLRGQYRLQGRCVRCGSYDHWVQSCPLQPYASGEGQTPQDTDSEGSSGTDRRKRVGT